MNQEHHNPNGAAIQAAHPSVFALPLGAHRVYAALCALLPLDEATDITQERIASFARVSESTVSRSMPVLAAHGLVERRPAEVGVGFILRLLPLPASTAAAAPSIAEPAATPSTAEDAAAAVEPALQATVALRIEIPTEQDPQRNESACMVDHDLDQQQQQQQHVRTAEPPLRTIPPRVWADMLRGTPGYDQMQFRQDLATLNRRGVGFANAVGIIVSARRAGEMIYGTDQVEAQAGGQHNLPVQPAPRPRRPAQGPRGGSSRKPGVRPPTLPPNHGRQFHGDVGGEA